MTRSIDRLTYPPRWIAIQIQWLDHGEYLADVRVWQTGNIVHHSRYITNVTETSLDRCWQYTRQIAVELIAVYAGLHDCAIFYEQKLIIIIIIYLYFSQFHNKNK